MIYIYTGTNDFARLLAVHQLTGAFVRQYGDLALERLDAESVSFDSLLGAVQSLPFLTDKKMVVVTGFGAGKAMAERIHELLAAVSDATDLLLNEGKVDKRGTYYKILKGQSGFKEFGELDEASLARWAVETARAEGGTLSSADARHLISRVGLDQQRLANELDKLLLYGPSIIKQTIDLLTDLSPHSTIFELLDAAFSGNASRALKLYDEQRQLRVEPQAMLGLIAWQLHILALVKAAGNRTPGEIASQGKVSPYVVKKSLSIARRLTMAQIKEIIHHTLLLDIRLKSEAIDADSALQNLILTIAQTS